MVPPSKLLTDPPLAVGALPVAESPPVAGAPPPTEREHVQRMTRQLTRRVARGSSMMLTGGMLARLLRFGLHVLLSRMLGPASYGLYALGRSIMHLVQSGAHLGLETGVIRFVAAQYGQGRMDEVKGTIIASLSIVALVSGTIGLLIFLTADLITATFFNADPAFTPVLRAFAASTPFFALNAVCARTARAFQRMKYDVAVGVVAQPLFNLLFVVAAFLLGYSLGGAVIAFLASTVVSAGIGLFLVFYLFPPLRSKLRPRYQVRRLLGFSTTALGAGMMALTMSEADRLMLGMLTTATDVGIYNIAALTASQSLLVLTAVNSSFSPMIAELYHLGRKDRLEALFKTTTRWVLTLSAPLALVLILFPVPVMRLFGDAYTAGASTLVVLTVAYLVNTGVGSVGYMLQMSDHHRILAANNVVMTVLNIGLNIVLIRRYGPFGAAVATGLSVSLINIVKLVEVYVLLGIHPYNRMYWKPALAAAVAAAAGLGVDRLMPGAWGWVVAMAVLGVVYFGVLLALRLDPEDDILLTAVRRKLGLPAPPTP